MGTVVVVGGYVFVAYMATLLCRFILDLIKQRREKKDEKVSTSSGNVNTK